VMLGRSARTREEVRASTATLASSVGHPGLRFAQHASGDRSVRLKAQTAPLAMLVRVVRLVPKYVKTACQVDSHPPDLNCVLSAFLGKSRLPVNLQPARIADLASIAQNPEEARAHYVRQVNSRTQRIKTLARFAGAESSVGMSVHLFVRTVASVNTHLGLSQARVKTASVVSILMLELAFAQLALVELEVVHFPLFASLVWLVRSALQVQALAWTAVRENLQRPLGRPNALTVRQEKLRPLLQPRVLLVPLDDLQEISSRLAQHAAKASSVSHHLQCALIAYPVNTQEPVNRLLARNAARVNSRHHPRHRRACIAEPAAIKMRLAKINVRFVPEVPPHQVRSQLSAPCALEGTSLAMSNNRRVASASLANIPQVEPRLVPTVPMGSRVQLKDRLAAALAQPVRTRLKRAIRKERVLLLDASIA
jgi:hypothetical protein